MKFKICNLACSQSVTICLQISELFLFLHLEVSFPCGYFLTIYLVKIAFFKKIRRNSSGDGPNGLGVWPEGLGVGPYGLGVGP